MNANDSRREPASTDTVASSNATKPLAETDHPRANSADRATSAPLNDTAVSLVKGVDPETGEPNGIAYVTLNRPAKLNSLTLPVLDELVATARTIRRDRSIRVVILSGAGGNFSAGLDFASALKSPAKLARTFAPRPWRGTNTFQEAPWAWRRLPIPVIAAVEGYCFGGGVQIAAAADYRFTSSDASWSVLEAKWGLVPDMSGIASLKQLLPIDTAKRLAMTGEILTGDKAVELGLASEVAADPRAAAEELAHQLIGRSPDSVAYAKRLFDETWTSGPRATFFKERVRQARLLMLDNTRIAQKLGRQTKSTGDNQNDSGSGRLPKFKPRSVR
ncbi:crotonase/enoyl-CoA hydratase family protein [uncultured Corynebacterium sp.]|uniref:crotonase/enoyl-CoA hydratase family protein n=1 Tax=uncultured Corynebacterium sp. TaxID=159447 RepID=UPI0025EB29C8|nr:crotonase/enoyl-CoA hydratase family protein [uncultured Corynebacterium sp.]